MEQDRIDLRDRGEQRALAAADEIARLHARDADQPVDRRRDARVAQVERRLLHRGLAGLDLRRFRVLSGARVVQFLLADGLLRHERRVARDVALRLLKPCLGRRELGLGRRQQRFERLAIDLVEQRALANRRAFLKFTVSRKPSTRARISTSWNPWVWPTSSR